MMISAHIPFDSSHYILPPDTLFVFTTFYFHSQTIKIFLLMERKTFPSSRKNSTEDALPQEVQPQYATQCRHAKDEAARRGCQGERNSLQASVAKPIFPFLSEICFPLVALCCCFASQAAGGKPFSCKPFSTRMWWECWQWWFW